MENKSLSFKTRIKKKSYSVMALMSALRSSYFSQEEELSSMNFKKAILQRLFGSFDKAFDSQRRGREVF